MQDLIVKSQPRWDSNPLSSDSKSDALSVSLCGLAGNLIFAVFVLLNMFNVLDVHNKYTVRIFIVSLYKITKTIDYKIAHQPPPPPLTRVDVPPHLLLELMSLTRVRCTLRGGTLGGGVRWWGGLLDVGYVEGVRWGREYVGGGGGGGG